jgi:uncharacterized membrane protein YgdD (TMEM256/DUF423 family)
MNMQRTFLTTAAVAGFLAVALGAFGAHGLKSHLSEQDLAVYRTAVDYHFWHALALGWLGLLMERLPDRRLNLAGWLFVAGLVIFCGSLYLLSISGMRWLGILTPFGGLAFMGGWLLTVLALMRSAR